MGSMRVTSAPSCASVIPASGTATKLEISMIRTPSRGRVASGCSVIRSSYQLASGHLDRRGLDGLLRQQYLQGSVAERDEAVRAGDPVDGPREPTGDERREHTFSNSTGLTRLVDD